jgi:predicted kinase
MDIKENLSGTFNDETAADRPDAMSEAEYQTAFQKMAADYFTGKTPEAKPTLLYVTGLPGAGKSTLVRAAKAAPQTKDYIVINFDDLRLYHPRYAEHVLQDPVNAAARIDTAVERLIGQLCEDAANRKFNIILDDAAMGAEMTRMVLSPFQANGYAVTAVVMSTPAAIARQSVHLRFEENFSAAQKGAPVLPRWVNATEQNNAPAALVETVETLENDPAIQSLTIVDRHHTVLNSLHLCAYQESNSQTVRTDLTRALTADEIALYQDTAAHIAKLMNVRTQVKAPEAQGKPVQKNIGF